jgi:predicted MFS family arabinose efflux permease
VASGTALYKRLPAAVQQYLVVTLSYWSFTITDGALRMLVLLYFHQLGYTPFELALLFVLYEFCGVICNLVGGWLGARFGLHRTLFAGMLLQIAALLMLTVPDAWLSVLYVMMAQALSGIAKDLNKMSAKSSVKLLVPVGQSGQLFNWVAALTGSKNALKGVGFFVGGLLLATVGFRGAMLGMAVWIAVFMLLSMYLLRAGIAGGRSSAPFSAVFSKSRGVNVLSAARFFLFGARDIWFVVAVPVFLYSVLDWSQVQTGTFLALWVIGYGFVQALAPRLVHIQSDDAYRQGRTAAMVWALVLTVSPLLIALALHQDWPAGPSLVVGLAVFGFLFAINSAVHSWLILEYARDEGASLDVGFYYMANAAGRLVGTLLSGLSFQYHGMIGALLTAAVFVALAALLARMLPLAHDKP